MYWTKLTENKQQTRRHCVQRFAAHENFKCNYGYELPKRKPCWCILSINGGEQKRMPTDLQLISKASSSPSSIKEITFSFLNQVGKPKINKAQAEDVNSQLNTLINKFNIFIFLLLLFFFWINNFYYYYYLAHSK